MAETTQGVLGRIPLKEYTSQCVAHNKAQTGQTTSSTYTLAAKLVQEGIRMSLRITTIEITM